MNAAGKTHEGMQIKGNTGKWWERKISP